MWCLLWLYACVCKLHNFIVSIKLLTQTLIVWLEVKCTENLIWLLKQDEHWGEPWNYPTGRVERRFAVSNYSACLSLRNTSSLSNLTTLPSRFVYISCIFSHNLRSYSNSSFSALCCSCHWPQKVTLDSFMLSVIYCISSLAFLFYAGVDRAAGGALSWEVE